MSLPEEDIEILLFGKAKEYTDLPVIFPNEAIGPPADGSGHVVVSHFRNDSAPYALASDGDSLNMGILQMLIRLKLNTGSSEMRKRGADIAALFWTPVNLSLSRNGTRVRIAKRPVLGTAIPVGASLQMPVSISYEVFI